MFGKLGGNRKLVVPLILAAVAAIAVAGLRTTKSVERNRTALDSAQPAPAGQQEAETGMHPGLLETGGSDGPPIDFVHVADRDPFSHWSLFSAGGGPGVPGPGGADFDDFESLVGASPFARLTPFAPLIGPGSDAGFDGMENGGEQAGSAGPQGNRKPPDPGFALASIIGGEKPLAIITDSSGAKFFASAGDAVSDGYSVEAIHSRSVVLGNGDLRISLWLGAASGRVD